MLAFREPPGTLCVRHRVLRRIDQQQRSFVASAGRDRVTFNRLSTIAAAAMKICVLQSCYEGSDNPVAEFDDNPQDPAMFTVQHEFQHRFIKKATAASQIDAAVAEGFDLYFNFMWGREEDDCAGVRAIQHLESVGVPFVGVTSKILSDSKLDFHRSAGEAGLPVPASGKDLKFPVFVKPSKLYGSVGIDERSVCRNQAELDSQLARVNGFLTPRRNEAAAHAAHHNSFNENGSSNLKIEGNDLGDIMVQEYIPGRDYLVTVIEMGNTPVAMNPVQYLYPVDFMAETGVDFLSFHVKFHPELREELLCRDDDPELFERLRDLAEKAWHINGMRGSNWCSVDIRVRDSDKKAFLIEVNSLPSVFYNWGSSATRCRSIHEWFPGDHRALVNVLITSTLHRVGQNNDTDRNIADTFDQFSVRYDELFQGTVRDVYTVTVAEFDFAGTVFELGCGTGLFGRLLHDQQSKNDGELSVIFGNDISEQMVRKNPRPETYKKVSIGPIQDAFMNTADGPFDHIVALSTLQYLDEVTISAVMARMFQLAQRSVTFTVDEIPEGHNEGLASKGNTTIVYNHLALVEGFGVPRGWRVASRKRVWGWKSPTTGYEVFLTVFRYEAVQAHAPSLVYQPFKVEASTIDNAPQINA